MMPVIVVVMIASMWIGGRHFGLLGLFQPMLVALQLEHVLVAALVVGPNVGVVDAHPVKRTLGQSIETVGQFLGIGKGAADALDRADVAARIDRHAPVAGGLAVAMRTLSPGANFALATSLMRSSSACP